MEEQRVTSEVVGRQPGADARRVFATARSSRKPLHACEFPSPLLHGAWREANPSTHLLFKKPSAESFLGWDYQLFFS